MGVQQESELVATDVGAGFNALDRHSGDLVCLGYRRSCSGRRIDVFGVLNGCRDIQVRARDRRKVPLRSELDCEVACQTPVVNVTQLRRHHAFAALKAEKFEISEMLGAMLVKELSVQMPTHKALPFEAHSSGNNLATRRAEMRTY